MKKWLTTGWLMLCILTVQAQKKIQSAPPKIPLSHAVYDSWKEISYRAISNDGNFAAFTVNPQEGDGKVILYNLKTSQQDSVSRAENISLVFGGPLAVFKIRPPFKLTRDLMRQKKKKDDLPKDTLGIYSFLSRKTEKIAEVKSYRLPEKSGNWLAYQLEPKKAPKPKTEDKAKGEEKKVSEKPKKKPKANSDDNGYTLVLRKFQDHRDVQFGYVKDFLFSKYGHALLFLTTGNDTLPVTQPAARAGVYRYDLTTEKLQTLYEGKAKYKIKCFSMSEDGAQAAFLVDTDTTKAPIHAFQLYYWKSGDAVANIWELEKVLAITPNWLVSENYTPLFSRDGSKLFIGTSPRPVVQDTTLLPEEIVNVEIWRGDDGYIYPHQIKQADTEKKRSYLAVIDLTAKSVVQLGTRELPHIEIANEGNASVFLGETNLPYRKAVTWENSSSHDLYLLDAKDRSQKTIALKAKGNATLSPLGNYVIWFSPPDTSWFCYGASTGKTVRLNDKMKVMFAEEEDDHPDFPGAYGSAGWTKNDELLLVYDRYDIWAFDPAGKKPAVNLTQTGRSQKTSFRYLKLDLEERYIDPSKDMVLSAFNEITKASGYYKYSFSDGKLTRLLMDNYDFRSLTKAKNANQILFTRETFNEFPDLWTSDMNFTSPRKLSDANPQMKKYLWGSVEPVKWTSLDNVPLNGLLYKPEGFDPKKKYPMMVYFYEKNSDELYSHLAPAVYGSTINYTMYTSNGYLVFVPDIVYKIGLPGESAYNCILPGVMNLISKGFVDEKHIGVQGHSWGGYQIAYLVTRTDLFAAAEAGAPVANMTSAYGGVRYETGLSRMFQYEKTQSRIGGTLWEKPMNYIENSPLFFANKINTPLLMMHNDADGAVPWTQGIEFYMALRRLNKPVWMLNYNGEGHNLKLRQNKTDLAIRMMQYFDHYLKNKPAPDWMTKGVPAIEKGITKGY